MPSKTSGPDGVTFRFSNEGYTTQPGERTFNGKMTRTGWRYLQFPTARHVVLDSYASNTGFSDLDTLLAAYSLDSKGKKTLVAFNDNAAFDGVMTKASRVEFEAARNIAYAVQMGTRNQAEGDIVIRAAVLPPGGGLSMAPAENSNVDGLCTIGPDAFQSKCPDQVFLVHNSTKETLTVTGSVSPGLGYNPVAPFTLKPGASAKARFVFPAGFDQSTAKSRSGSFSFVGKGTKTYSVSEPALLAIHKLDPVAPKLQASGPSLLISTKAATYGGSWFEFRNVGTTKAVGCYPRIDISTPYLSLRWRRVSVDGKKPVGPLNPVLDIPVGGKVRIAYAIASEESRDGDLIETSSTPVTFHCANADDLTPVVKLPLFDVTALIDDVGFFERTGLTPPSEPIVLPAAGKVVATSYKNTGLEDLDITITVANSAGDGTLTVKPAICPVSFTPAKCLAQTTTSLTARVKAGKLFTFRLAAKPVGTGNGGAVVSITRKVDAFFPFAIGGNRIAFRR